MAGKTEDKDHPPYDNPNFIFPLFNEAERNWHRHREDRPIPPAPARPLPWPWEHDVLQMRPRETRLGEGLLAMEGFGQVPKATQPLGFGLQSPANPQQYQTPGRPDQSSLLVDMIMRLAGGQGAPPPIAQGPQGADPFIQDPMMYNALQGAARSGVAAPAAGLPQSQPMPPMPRDASGNATDTRAIWEQIMLTLAPYLAMGTPLQGSMQRGAVPFQGRR